LYGHRVGQQLVSGHWTLREIDAQFRNLLNERRIPKLIGIEAYENHFILHRKWLPDKQVVVPEESAGRYFGAAKLLRDTDHFSTVKPTSREHPAYELLADFFEKKFGKDDITDASGQPATVTFVFERAPTYPILRFSVVHRPTAARARQEAGYALTQIHSCQLSRTGVRKRYWVGASEMDALVTGRDSGA
jgi:hypothetical protein